MNRLGVFLMGAGCALLVSAGLLWSRPAPVNTVPVCPDTVVGVAW